MVMQSHTHWTSNYTEVLIIYDQTHTPHIADTHTYTPVPQKFELVKTLSAISDICADMCICVYLSGDKVKEKLELLG